MIVLVALAGAAAGAMLVALVVASRRARVRRNTWFVRDLERYVRELER